MTILQNFFNSNLIIIFISSFVLNSVIIIIIQKGFLGQNCKVKLNQILDKNENVNLVLLIMFIIIFSITTYLEMNKIYLDNKDVIVKAVIENSDVLISGNVVDSIFSNLGSVGAFIIGAKITNALLIKSKLPIIPKVGTIGIAGSGFTMMYKVTCQAAESMAKEKSGIITYNTGPIHIEVINPEITNKNIPIKSLLEQKVNFYSKTNINLETKTGLHNIEIKGDKEVSSKLISELEKDPNWKDICINSPLENGDSLNEYFIGVLYDNLLLHSIMLYLLFMLIFFITSKLLASTYASPKIVQLSILKKLPISNNISNLLNRIYSIWHSSYNFWIFLIIFSLICFTSASIFSLYHLMVILQ
uniref:Uncharacterized protein n=1 Tax=Amanita thiersii TaxID=235537 RepID=A0A5Q0N2E4_9AGAR|nr:hypothetical protein [Amanita thiersii]QFZ98702.1 hypothetical protein [Amanita thiersii]